MESYIRHFAALDGIIAAISICEDDLVTGGDARQFKFMEAFKSAAMCLSPQEILRVCRGPISYLMGQGTGGEVYVVAVHRGHPLNKSILRLIKRRILRITIKRWA